MIFVASRPTSIIGFLLLYVSLPLSLLHHFKWWINIWEHLALRTRKELFRENTKTKKTIQIVFISTYGLKLNKYSGLVSALVTLDDLFTTAEW